MAWYKVWLVVPGTDGDAENGPCEPQWWNDYVRADSEEDAVAQANAGARADWEAPAGVFPSAKGLGFECPVCTGAQAATDEEHAAWVEEMGGSSLWGFHPASVRTDPRMYDEKECIIYIFGLTFDMNGEDHPWTELYTAKEKARFAAALN